jgi:DNA-binding XRE family transcriptional regulator
MVFGVIPLCLLRHGSRVEAEFLQVVHATTQFLLDSAQFGDEIIGTMNNNKFLGDSNTKEIVEQLSGKRLKLFRILAGLRQYDVAARIGIPATKLCEIEGGRRQASPELLQRILAAIEGGQGAKKG